MIHSAKDAINEFRAAFYERGYLILSYVAKPRHAQP